MNDEADNSRDSTRQPIERTTIDEGNSANNEQKGNAGQGHSKNKSGRIFKYAIIGFAVILFCAFVAFFAGGPPSPKGIYKNYAFGRVRTIEFEPNGKISVCGDGIWIHHGRYFKFNHYVKCTLTSAGMKGNKMSFTIEEDKLVDKNGREWIPAE